jgi:hypothetical protein
MRECAERYLVGRAIFADGTNVEDRTAADSQISPTPSGFHGLERKPARGEWERKSVIQTSIS